MNSSFMYDQLIQIGKKMCIRDSGYYYAHEAGIYSEKDLGPLANYIDYERYGRCLLYTSSS